MRQRVPVINNVDVKAETDADAIRHALIRQLYSPVRWTESVEAMAAQGVTQLIEMGPGKVLTGLTKRIVDGLSAAAGERYCVIDCGACTGIRGKS
ncbi:hypothetical protein WDV93_00050 [Pantoea ananatis]